MVQRNTHDELLKICNMSGLQWASLEAGLFLAVAPLGFAIFQATKQSIRAIYIDYQDLGILKTFLLWTLFFQAQTVTSRVRNYVIARPEEMDQAWVIRKSFATSFSMIAVAASGNDMSYDCQCLTLTSLPGSHCGADCDHGTIITV